MFPFGFGAKKDRGSVFSVLAGREMKREPKNEPFFRAVFDSRSSLSAPKPRGNVSFVGSRFISRPAKSENPVPQSFFAPKPNGNACYAGYSIINWVS